MRGFLERVSGCSSDRVAGKGFLGKGFWALQATVLQLRGAQGKVSGRYRRPCRRGKVSWEGFPGVTRDSYAFEEPPGKEFWMLQATASQLRTGDSFAFARPPGKGFPDVTGIWEAPWGGFPDV